MGFDDKHHVHKKKCKIIDHINSNFCKNNKGGAQRQSGPTFVPNGR